MGDGLPMDPYHVMAIQYDDDIGRDLNFLGYSMEVMMHHLAISPQDGAAAHYTYIPTWDKHWAERDGRADPSGYNLGDVDE